MSPMNDEQQHRKHRPGEFFATSCTHIKSSFACTRHSFLLSTEPIGLKSEEESKNVKVEKNKDV